MSFKLLKEVIAHMRKTQRCHSCGAKFDEDLLFVLTTAVNPGAGNCFGLFFVACDHCQNSVFIMAELSEKAICFETKPTKGSKPISMNEILDMRNFLKDYRGDVKELFKDL